MRQPRATCVNGPAHQRVWLVIERSWPLKRTVTGGKKDIMKTLPKLLGAALAFVLLLTATVLVASPQVEAMQQWPPFVPIPGPAPAPPCNTITVLPFVDTDYNGSGSGDPLPAGLAIELFDVTHSTHTLVSTKTSANAAVEFGCLQPGSYQVDVGNVSLITANVGADWADSDIDPVTGRSHVVVIRASRSPRVNIGAIKSQRVNIGVGLEPSNVQVWNDPMDIDPGTGLPWDWASTDLWITDGCRFGTATITVPGTYTGPMTEWPPGSGGYMASFPVVGPGPHTVTTHIDCPSGPDEIGSITLDYVSQFVPGGIGSGGPSLVLPRELTT